MEPAFSKSTAFGRPSFTLNTVSLSGNGVPALNCALANASPKFWPTPITSPVERISGPSAGSTPGNLLNGNTGDFTKLSGTGRRPRCSVTSQLLAEHQLHRQLRQRHACCFADIRHRSRCPRIHFEHV